MELRTAGNVDLRSYRYMAFLSFGLPSPIQVPRRRLAYKFTGKLIAQPSQTLYPIQRLRGEQYPSPADNLAQWLSRCTR